MWNFKLTKETHIIQSIIFPYSVFVKIQLKWIVVACTFSSMQLKWNLIWPAQRSNKWAESEVWWNLKEGVQHQQPQRTSTFHSCYFILLFCSRPVGYFGFFYMKRFLHLVLQFEALAKLCKPSLVKFSWFMLRVAQVSRTALANKRYFSARLEYSSLGHC